MRAKAGAGKALSTGDTQEAESDSGLSVTREIQQLEAEARALAADSTRAVENSDYIDARFTADEDTPKASSSSSPARPAMAVNASALWHRPSSNNWAGEY